MGFFKSKKSNVAVTTPEYSPYSSNSPEFSKERNSGYSSLTIAKLEKKDLKHKRRIRILRFIIRSISLILSGFMIGTLSFTLAKYFTTRDRTLNGAQVWGKPKVIWPTYLVLSISALTFILNVVTLAAYICSIGAANKAGDLTIYVGYATLGIEVIVWLATSAIYRVADTGTDLWGYSCGKQADKKLLAEAESFIDFGKLCSTQTGTWFSTIVQATLHLLTFITLILVWRRSKGKKRAETFRISQMQDNGQFQNVEMGAIHKPSGWRRYMPLSGASRNS